MIQPIISVIIPVHNMAQYLQESIGGWLNQTLEDIEVICVDDASTDNSWEVLRQFAANDCRVVIHRFEHNVSAWVARKWGIQQARGTYIMFADADDTIEHCACAELLGEMKRHPVDILHFGTNIINVNHLPEERIANMEKFLAPYPKKLRGEEVFTRCFEKNDYKFSIWNKIFSAKLCKDAVCNTEDWFLPKAQDKLLYFIIALNASSYRGIPAKKYYNYYFGRGGTGFNQLTLQQFQRYCTMADTANAMHQYLQEKELLERFGDISVKNRKELLADCVTRFFDEIPDLQKDAAFSCMLEKWGIADTVAAIAEKRWFDRYVIARSLQNCSALKWKKREIKTIATYYHSCANGGAQRVMCDLSGILAGMGYRVIVITDEEPSEMDYPLPDSAVRLTIPDCKTIDRKQYQIRAEAITRIAQEYHVDVVLNHAWVLNMMLWDELVWKANNVAYIAHCHNVFSLPVLRSYENARNYIAPYLLADAVVTLSDTDQYYWQHFNPNTFVTVNPALEGAESWQVSSGLDRKQILWCGRLSSEKRPYDTLWIMRRVIQQIPDAHLHIVGSSPDEQYMTDFVKRIESMGLSENITVHGFQSDVAPFYQSASLFLMTSQYEGYPLTLQESKLAGLPCVMYEMPYLSLCAGKRGIWSVPQGSPKEAAEAIVELLNNDEMRHSFSKEAKAHITEILSFNFQKKWQEILDSLGTEKRSCISEESMVMVNTLIEHHDICLKAEKNKIKRPGKKGGFLISKIIGGLQCCVEHGVWYTAKYSIKKLFWWAKKHLNK